MAAQNTGGSKAFQDLENRLAKREFSNSIATSDPASVTREASLVKPGHILQKRALSVKKQLLAPVDLKFHCQPRDLPALNSIDYVYPDLNHIYSYVYLIELGVDKDHPVSALCGQYWSQLTLQSHTNQKDECKTWNTWS